MKKIIVMIVVSLAIVSIPLHAQDWTKESNDRSKRAALHDSVQQVRGDSGKWSDDARLQHAPPIEQKPARMALDDWAEKLLKAKVELTDKDNNWLILRTEQLDDNDRVWIEKIERRGNKFTVVLNEAVWQGRYNKTFTYYEVTAVNLGPL
uniref:hypothetical protein n=1 Tax=Roseateles sp. TaxID=1971397 RepID=UPI00286AE1B8